MAVIKVKSLTGFTIINNEVLENPRLSFKAKGLWAYCMSRPDNWEFHVSHLSTVSKEREDAIYAALKELELEGLITRQQSNQGKGTGGGRGGFGKMDYIIYALPQKIQKCFTQPDFPETEVRLPENPALLNTESKQVLKKEPPPTPKTKDEWRRFFSDWLEEEFEFAWNEYEKAPKGSVKSLKSWLPRVRQRYNAMSENKPVSDRIVKSRHHLAKSWDGRKWRGDKVWAYPDRVEFTDGSYFKSVRYDVPEEQWIKETGWSERA